MENGLLGGGLGGRGGPETIRRLLRGARWQITEVVELGEVGGFGVYFV